LYVCNTNIYVCEIDIVYVCVYLYVMNADRIYRNLGKRIKDLRKGIGRTQDQIAKQVGISRASLANIEAGRQKLLVHHLFELAEALDLESPADLLLEKQTKTRQAVNASPLPISGDGLTEMQRREVLSLMGNTQNNNNENEGREDG